VGAEPNVTAVP